MIPLQDLEFRLKSGEVVFSQLIATGNGGFTANATEAFPATDIPIDKFYRWLPCPRGSDAVMAFREVATAVANYASKTPDNEIVSINNPCNCEFVTANVQQKIVGPHIDILVNGVALDNA